MNYFTDITGYRAAGEGVDLLVHLPQDIRYLIKRQNIRHAEVILDDGRHISIDQRKKIYATLRDISEYIGDPPEATKEWMKYGYIERTGSDYFSLSNCSMTTAREFINFLMDVCLQSGIILTESGLKRTDDINAYLIQCIRHKRCCICGRPADIHHVDAIGMGNDRRNFDDSENDIIALCREHHTQAHSLGNVRFMERYKVYGIKKYQTVDAEDFGHFENITKM
ncbi:putative HNHc nuclease [[Clostridium] symbiosum]|uniref:putative HNHc nuclease n=1 Tax=Clostridium symbiosum TaxID=1512 RepID=UPI0023307B74|nr:putative HNHc nuclease [[Clostridium] symbiosum]MDB2011718.1 putative HNHc nuclease [[Clostridium] symbiosum]MDB2029507.1 putative HNHc nuclease [[Clostridium] symbiosum]